MNMIGCFDLIQAIQPIIFIKISNIQEYLKYCTEKLLTVQYCIDLYVPRDALMLGRLYQKILTRTLLPLFENSNRRSSTVPYRFGISKYAVKHDIVSIPNRYGTVQPEPRKESGFGVPYRIGTVAAQGSKGNLQKIISDLAKF